MRFSFKTAPMQTTWPEMRDVWLEADGIHTFDAGWTFDHFYPLGGDPAGPCLEGWTVTTALGALTSRLRFGVMVLGNTYRHPAVVANMAATLDVITEGRLELGIGAGWHEPEHAAYGIELPALRERFDRLDEALEVIHLLLTEEVADFDGLHYQLREASCEPKPVQQPRPPIVIGGTGERRTLRAVARWADQWNFPGGAPDELRRLVGVLNQRCEEVGRNPTEVEVSVQVRHNGDPAETAHQVAEFRDAGADHAIVILMPPFNPSVLDPVASALDALR